MKNRSGVKVLYVEDDASDADFARIALKDIGCENFKLDVIPDGEQAINFLTGNDGATTEPLPDMVLLDLNVPKVPGKDILKAMKSSDHLRTIPVVVLSTSKHQKDIDDSFHLGAAGYFTKPTDFEEYKETFRAICDYWVHKSQLPSKNPTIRI